MGSQFAHLRDLADWHRKFAELAGSDHERQSRLRFAEYLDRRAAELEAAPGPQRAVPAKE